MSTKLPRPRARRRFTQAAVTLGAALWLAGCASLQPKAPEEVVRERAEQRWAALIDRDFEKAWEYTQPGYRAVMRQKDYRNRFGVAGQWLGAQVHDVKCEAERCTVKLRLTTKVLVPPFANREMVNYYDEPWVREDGQWWFYQTR